LIIAIHFFQAWILGSNLQEISMIEIGVDVLGAKRGGDHLRGVFYLALRDIHPQIVETGIIQLQIRGVKTNQVGVVRVVIEQPREVIPIGLEDS
jgi:hypothetical protein